MKRPRQNRPSWRKLRGEGKKMLRGKHSNFTMPIKKKLPEWEKVSQTFEK